MLIEAAFMTGLERNADVVHMASYAPLLAHVDAWQWRPDLIWFNNLKSIGSPNYYVQKLFSNNRGTHVIQVLSDSKALAGQDSLYASGTIDRVNNRLCIKLVNASSSSMPVKLNISGAILSKETSLITLSGKKDDYNTIQDSERIVPITRKVELKGKSLELEVVPLSMYVLVIPIRL